MAEHSRRKRAREVMNKAGYKSGGHLKHPDAKEDKILIDRQITKAIGEHDKQLHEGKKTHLKLKDGGMASGKAPRVRGDKKPRHKTVVNVVVGQGEKPVPAPVPVPVPAAGGAPAGAPPLPPPSRIPVGVPLGQKHGGHSKATFKKGGKIPVPMSAGAGGAKGRLEKIKDYGAK